MTTTTQPHPLVGRDVRDRHSGTHLGVIIAAAPNYSHTDLPVYQVKCDDHRTRRFYGDELDVDQRPNSGPHHVSPPLTAPSP